MKNLCGRIGMGFEQTDNIPFEGVELAGAGCTLAWFEGRVEPLSNGSDVHGQFPGDLRDRQPVVCAQMVDFAVKGVIDHDRPSAIRLKICSTD
ncbi:hypothetical protein DESC_970018 [Desulfosarcina cetonica]|nr:hypothetical protein DESC_970018 [Desulfosarcina cetonica]